MLADCGQFELWRKGEWVTKEDTGYAMGECQLAVVATQEPPCFPCQPCMLSLSVCSAPVLLCVDVASLLSK
jgi:hypothetical protein